MPIRQIGNELSLRLTVQYRSLDSLIRRSSNARTHSIHQIRQIAESIRFFGSTNPILIDRNGVIIAGQGRFEAAKLLGLERVPTIVLDALTPDQVRAFVISDNRSGRKQRD